MQVSHVENNQHDWQYYLRLQKNRIGIPNDEKIAGKRVYQSIENFSIGRYVDHGLLSQDPR